MANAQGSPLKSTARDALETHRSGHVKHTARDGPDTQRTTTTKFTGKDKEGIEALSPIREMTIEEEAAVDKKMSQYSMSVMRDSMKENDDHEMKVGVCYFFFVRSPAISLGFTTSR